MTSSKVSQELRSKNPWYIEDQHRCAAEESQKRLLSERQKFIRKSIADFSRAGETIMVLDGGCGDGVNLTYLSDIPKTHLYGLEYNPVRLARAGVHVSTAHLVLGDLLSNPFRKESFDVILLNHVLEHIADDSLVLQELNRILKPNGILILGVPNEGCFIAQLRNNIVQRQIKRTTDHVQQYTEDTIRKRLATAGWRVQTVRREGFFLPHMFMNTLLTRFDAGFRIIKYLCQHVPSQCGGFHFICVKEVS